MARNTAGLYVALIRGINVGRAKRVAMSELRASVEGPGYSDVRTLLNSGNVVFTGPRSAPSRMSSRIERALEKRTGIRARAIVLSGLELAQVVEENSLLEMATDPSRLLVAILGEARDRRLLEPLLKENWLPDALALGGRAAYLWCSTGILNSRIPPAIDRVLGDAVTSRNWATILKLHALVDAGSGDRRR